MPAVERAFLDANEREADAESRDAMAEGLDELARARRIQQDAQRATRPLSDEMQERVRQYDEVPARGPDHARVLPLSAVPDGQ